MNSAYFFICLTVSEILAWGHSNYLDPHPFVTRLQTTYHAPLLDVTNTVSPSPSQTQKGGIIQ